MPAITAAHAATASTEPLPPSGRNACGIVFRQPNEATVESFDLPEPGPADAVVRIEFSGVSIGTEQSIFSGARTHNGKFPLIGGYMACGVVEWIGAEVEGLVVGTRVVSMGTRLHDGINAVWGGHCSRHVTAAAGLIPVPKGVGSDEASLFILPAVALNAAEVAGVTDRDTVLVQGQGLIGQLFSQWCRRRGAAVWGIEPNRLRREIAQRAAGIEVLDPAENGFADRLKKLPGGGPSVVVEATGNARLIDVAAGYLRHHSRFVFLGWYPEEVAFKYHAFHANEATAFFPTGAGDAATTRAVLAAMADGTLRIEKNITDRVPFREAPRLYERVVAGDRSIMGAVIDWRSL